MNDKIDDYKRNLYSRKYNDTTKEDLDKISELKNNKNTDLENNWDSVEKRLNKNNNLYKYERNETSTFSIIFFISFSFFIIAAGVAGFFLYFQKTDIPLNQLEYSLLAPNTVDSGDILEYVLEFENNTDYKFNDIEVFVKYPKGSVDDEGRYPKEKDSWAVDDILPGGKIKVRKKIILSGSPKEEKKIQIVVNYQFEGYSSILSKEKEFSVKIDSAPVFVKINTPKNIMSNEEFDISIEILSNSNTPLKNIVLIGRYPNGFEIIENNPEAVYSTNYKNIFKVDSLKIGEKKEIKIRAKLKGENSETKVLSFAVGDASNDSNEILTEYFNAKEKIILKKPSLDIKLVCNGKDFNSDSIVSRAGEVLSCKYNLFNNLASKVTDISINMKYQDDLILESRTKSKNSFIESNDNLIIWNKNNYSKLLVLRPGESVESEFEFEFKPVGDLAGYVKNPNMKLNFQLKGTNFDNENIIGDVTNEILKTVKLNTDIILESETNFDYDENDLNKYSPWKNTGSLSPVVGDLNTYAITWKIYNSTNKIKDIKVVAKLPLWVKFENIIYPKGNYVTYDKNTREVKWSIKQIEPYIGYRTDPKKVSFKVSFTPTLGQVGGYAELIGQKTLSAKDIFTDNLLEVKIKKDNTFIDDGNVPYGTGKITE